MTDLTGHRVGHYHLIKLIGHGGYADVYLGEHIHLKTLAAVKILRRPLARRWRGQFLREARITASLRHPKICRILDYGLHKGVPYLVMQYAPGGSLRDRYPQGSTLPFEIILNYLEQIVSALDYLHAKGLVHLDIKPENFLIGDNGEIWLSDFGIAELARRASTQQAGTPAYMSPEAFRGRLSEANDQYSLGVMVFEWLAGRRPFQGSRAKLYRQHLNASPPSLCALDPDITPEMEQVMLRALAKDPRWRYPSVRAFMDDLKQAMVPVLPSGDSGETLSLKRYLLKMETWEEVSKFFVAKLFISAVIALFAFLLSHSMEILLFTFGACIPFMPLQEIFRRRNLLAQSIASCAFFIALPISFSMHSFSAFPLVQVSLLIVCIWIIFLRKHIPRLRLDASFINKLRTWLDLFKRFIL